MNFRTWGPSITLNSNAIIFARVQSKHPKHLLLTLPTSVPEHDLFKSKELLLVESFVLMAIQASMV